MVLNSFSQAIRDQSYFGRPKASGVSSLLWELQLMTYDNEEARGFLSQVSILTDRRGTPLCSVFHKANKSEATLVVSS